MYNNDLFMEVDQKLHQALNHVYCEQCWEEWFDLSCESVDPEEVPCRKKHKEHMVDDQLAGSLLALQLVEQFQTKQIKP